MELDAILQQLYLERQRLEETINCLQCLRGENHGIRIAPKTRGRKSMGPEERRQVSGRMRLRQL